MTEFEFINYIRSLRSGENIPLFFRRHWLKDGKVIWYIWYGDTLIAYRVNQKVARQAVDVAASVHWAMNENRIKAA